MFPSSSLFGQQQTSKSSGFLSGQPTTGGQGFQASTTSGYTGMNNTPGTYGFKY